MFPATGTSHSVETVEHRQKIFIRKIRTVSSDTSRGERVFSEKWRRFKDFEIISIFLYVVLHTVRRISSFSAKIYRFQSVVKVSMKFARSFASFSRKSREKEQKSFLSLFIYIYLFVLPSIITIIYNNILLITKQSSRTVIVGRNARIAATDQNFERR